MSQLITSITNWLEEAPVEKLFNLEHNIKRVIAIKRLISQREKEIKSLDDQPLFMFTDEFEDEMLKEEKRREIKELNKLLNDQRVRNIGKLDIPSLRNVGRMTDKYIEKKLAFEDPTLRKFIMTPVEIEEYDRKKNEERQRRINEEERKLEEIQQKKALTLAETAERIKKEKQESFEKLKNDLRAQITKEPYRISPVFNFVEPVPNCHYDIGPSLGHVVIPIPFVDYNNPMNIIEWVLKDF